MPFGVNMSVGLEICGVYQPWLMCCNNKVVIDWRTVYPVKLNNICFGVTDCFYVVCLYRFEMKTHRHTQFTLLLWHSITLPQMVPTSCMQFATAPTSKFLCLIAPSPQVLISGHSSLMADYNLPFLARSNDVPHWTLCFSAHVDNNLAVVIITHLPRSWESSASIVRN